MFDFIWSAVVLLSVRSVGEREAVRFVGARSCRMSWKHAAGPLVAAWRQLHPAVARCMCCIINTDCSHCCRSCAKIRC